ncbi:MAG: 1-acyl-sn-glycerol-3-phosphate acyltransferase [Chloroflexota bacterium]|nr:MAG: 1-acyl-sn-glycerol-3-phosphate acyltransferase [Chloroflexota bacterium]
MKIQNPQLSGSGGYNHAEWENKRRFLRFLLRTLAFTLLVRLEHVEGLENIPEDGGGILLMNHIGWVDPIVLVHVVPRNIVPLGKVEAFEYPVIGIFPKLWGAIPVHREGVDRRAIQDALDVLKKGEIILVAPEGTRNPDLQKGKGGFAYLASRSRAPIIPVAIEGSPGYPVIRYSRRWRESPITVKFGRPIVFREQYQRAGRDELKILSDEVMYYLSAMLPEERRGYYSDLTKATQNTFEII